MTQPMRSEVWNRSDFVTGDPATRVVIISSDDWNERNANHVLCAPIEPYAPDVAATGFDILFTQDDKKWLIRSGFLIDVSRAELTERSNEVGLGENVIAALNGRLRSIIDSSSQRFSAQAPPQQRQACFAELHIAGQGHKPVVVVSGSGYAAEMGFTLVIGARMTSNTTKVYPFDVEVRGREASGKVVCSDLYVIPANDLRLRQRRPDPPVLSSDEWAAVRGKVLEFLGVP